MAQIPKWATKQSLGLLCSTNQNHQTQTSSSLYSCIDVCVFVWEKEPDRFPLIKIPWSYAECVYDTEDSNWDFYTWADVQFKTHRCNINFVIWEDCTSFSDKSGNACTKALYILFIYIIYYTVVAKSDVQHIGKICQFYGTLHYVDNVFNISYNNINNIFGYRVKMWIFKVGHVWSLLCIYYIYTFCLFINT